MLRALLLQRYSRYLAEHMEDQIVSEYNNKWSENALELVLSSDSVGELSKVWGFVVYCLFVRIKNPMGPFEVEFTS